MKNTKKIISIIILSFLLATNIFANGFEKGICSPDLTLHQNLNAPWPGQRYIKNGKYNRYTRGIVNEADVLQKHLNRLGFNAGKVDGVIGPKTRAAILRLQKYLGTKADGYVGPKTRALLNNSCGSIQTTVKNQNYTGDLKIAHNEKELKSFLNKTKNYNQYTFGANIVSDTNAKILLRGTNFGEINIDKFDRPMLMEDTIALNSKSAGMGADSDDFSKTNIQVGGVDEADTTKTDGKYIYTISGRNKIYIFDAEDPEDMQTVAQINAKKNENINGIYLYKNKLISISNFWEEEWKKRIAGSDYYPYRPGRRITKIKIYNIANPEKPIKEKEFEFEGNFKDSRITDGNLYLITNKNIYNDFPIMPMLKVDGIEYSKKIGNNFYYIDSPFSNNNITSISGIQLDNNFEISTKRILIPRSGNIYVSKNNLYLTYNKWNNYEIYRDLEKEINKLIIESENEFGGINLKRLSTLNSEWQPKLKPTEETIIKEKTEEHKNLLKKKDEINKKFNKRVKKLIQTFYAKHENDFEKTKIEKFELKDGKVTEKASGEVSGYTLNQFSMHENEDENFFVATTNNSTWIPWQLRRFLDNDLRIETRNNLFSLDKNLKNLDSLENMASGERIKSVRFIKNHAYLVTFKQIDPLFNISISNPKKLKLLGELKIDGFSQYLHPVYKDRLIGLGRDVKVNKYGGLTNGGLKITLFDISQDKPKEIQTIILGNNGSYSEALNNHKAVLISENKNIMAFPVTLSETDENSYKYKRQDVGIELLKINKNNISEISLLKTEDDWEQKAKRAVRIGDVIYAISDIKARSFKIKDGEELGKIFYEEDKEIISYEKN